MCVFCRPCLLWSTAIVFLPMPGPAPLYHDKNTLSSTYTHQVFRMEYITNVVFTRRTTMTCGGVPGPSIIYHFSAPKAPTKCLPTCGSLSRFGRFPLTVAPRISDKAGEHERPARGHSSAPPHIYCAMPRSTHLSSTNGQRQVDESLAYRTGIGW